MYTTMVDKSDLSNSSGGVLTNLEDLLREEKSKSQTQSYQPSVSQTKQASASASTCNCNRFWIKTRTESQDESRIWEMRELCDVGMGELVD